MSAKDEAAARTARAVAGRAWLDGAATKARIAATMPMLRTIRPPASRRFRECEPSGSAMRLKARPKRSAPHRPPRRNHGIGGDPSLVDRRGARAYRHAHHPFPAPLRAAAIGPRILLH